MTLFVVVPTPLLYRRNVDALVGMLAALDRSKSTVKVPPETNVKEPPEEAVPTTVSSVVEL